MTPAPGYPIIAAEQYEIALAVACPFDKCRAPAGQRCNGGIFPQYPHNSRFATGLRAQGRDAEADKFEADLESS